MIKYTTIHTVINRFYRQYKTTLSIADAVEWSSEALSQINSNIKGDEHVAFITVENYQCLLPNGCKKILQIALNKDLLVTENLIDIELINENGISEYIENIDIEVKPYFEKIIPYLSWTSSSLFNKFVPITLTNNTFFKSLVCRDTQIDSVEHLEYTIIEGSVLRFNFKEGQISISFIKEKLDENGYPMIPDDISFLTAIEKYIILQIMNYQYFTHGLGSQERKLNAEREWQFYCRQAKNKGLLPSSIDEYESLLKSQVHLVNDNKKYEKFFK